VTTIDCLVIGAGVIGLAAARAMSQRGHDVVIAEAERSFGNGISARNSGVIHAGIHYPAGSLKALACVEGRDRLYAYSAERRIPHRRCGKLIVATTPDQIATLEAIDAQARRNGVDDLRMLDRGETLALEPALRASAALLSPSTGIIDGHSLMQALLADAEAHGAVLALDTRINRLKPGAEDIALFLERESDAALSARMVINAGGLGGHAIAAATEGLDARDIPPLHLAKGCYFVLGRRSPFSRLIYPVPVPGGLGTHLTLDLAGAARFGPDVEWVEAIDYAVDPSRAVAFYTAIRGYWPDLADGDLVPGYAGIRPKLSGPGEPARDFRISGPADHGIAGLVNLFGIESPGLTASLALADRIAAMISER
jgi:L-2-hydroxyglutarate oxidase LhgO